MHAVVVDVTITGDAEEAVRGLREGVIPRVKEAPGVVAGYWLAPIDGKGHSIVVFESEEAAQAMAEQVRGNAPSPVTIDNVQVRAVVANV